MWILNLTDNLYLIIANSVIVGLVLTVVYKSGVKRLEESFHPNHYRPFTLIKKVLLNHDSRMYRFSLPSEGHAPLPVGQHAVFRLKDKNGKDVTKSYTPTSYSHSVGYIDFVFKTYFPDEDTGFAGGKMTMLLEELKEGDVVEMKGPIGRLSYKGNGLFNDRKRGDRQVTKIGMIAGGSGIVPMINIIATVLREGCPMKISLLFANKTEEDIVLRKMLERIDAFSPDFSLHYTLDHPPPGWTHDAGYITTEMVSKYMPKPGPETLIFYSGPKEMHRLCVEPALVALGYGEEMRFKY